MADRITFQTDDDLSEVNLTEANARTNQTDYVVRGLSFSADFGNNTLDITSGNEPGHAVIETANNEAYDVFADDRTGLSLTDSTTNHVWLTIDPSTDDSVTVNINTSGSDPAGSGETSLKIGEVDTSADTTTELNRGPAMIGGAVSISAAYTTNGETVVFVDTSSSAVTVTLATADATLGKEIRVVDMGNNAGTNAITIDTEGSATFIPGGASSITITTDGAYVDLQSDGTDWFADLNAEKDLVATEELATNSYWIPATHFRSVSGSPTLDTIASGSDAYNAWKLPDGSTTEIATDIPLALVYGTGTYRIRLYWASADTNGDDARIFSGFEGSSTGEDVRSRLGDVGTTSNFADSTTAHGLVDSSIGAWEGSFDSSDDIVHLTVGRTGSNSQDTLTTSANVIGIEFRRTA